MPNTTSLKKIKQLVFYIIVSTITSGCGQDTGTAPDIFTKVYVYQSDSTYSAQTMPSRSGTTNSCSEAYTANNSSWRIECGNFVAFVGYSNDNGVLNLPSTYRLPTGVPYLSVDEETLADDWDDFKTDIDVGLTGTGFSSVISWTGVNNRGALLQNCNDWTSTLNSVNATRSQINSSGAVWSNGSFACDFATTNLPVVCLCW